MPEADPKDKKIASLSIDNRCAARLRAYAIFRIMRSCGNPHCRERQTPFVVLGASSLFLSLPLARSLILRLLNEELDRMSLELAKLQHRLARGEYNPSRSLIIKVYAPHNLLK